MIENLTPKKYPISEDYEITREELGIGVNGKVVKCVKHSTKETFALKILPVNDKSRREVDLHWRASICEHVVKIIDVYENYNESTKKLHLLIVLELMAGGELFSRIQQKADRGFNEKEAASIVIQISNAIRFLHENHIAHRDLKPENLLYKSTEDNSLIKLTDFGFAKEVINNQLLQTPCFTPYYVAPEVLDNGKYDKSCDLWSLGVITYILLCGYPPFYSQSGYPISPGMKTRIRNGDYTFPDSDWANVSDNAIDLIKNLLIVDPNRRMTILEVLDHVWLTKYLELPQVPLKTTKVLTEDADAWPLVQDEFESALRTMRGNQDNKTIRLKKLSETTNVILKKRRDKNQ